MEKTSKVVTEDLGLIFEKAICNYLNIKYEGRFKYSEEQAEKLVEKLAGLNDLIAGKEFAHTAKN